MKAILRAIVLALRVSPAVNASASIATVPAATLLLPYFETGLANPNGRNTVFRIGNVSGEAALAHVTLWTDLGVPTLDFDVYLDGYDVTTIDMRLFSEGIVPQTSATMVNHGAFSLAPTSFPGCGTIQPVGQLTPALVAHLAAVHTGQVSAMLGGNCAGFDHGDGKAMGYVTVDRVNRCSLLFPSAPGYFSGPTRVASDENTLWVEYWLIDREQNSSFEDTLVHIEASARDPRTTTPNTTAFYGLFVNWSADDHREALATTWQARAFVGALGFGSTKLFIWRDPSLVAQPFVCGALPLPFSLIQTQTLAFDEDGNPFELPPGDALVGPSATNAIAVGGRNLPTPYAYGIVVLDLDTSVGSPVDPVRQSYVAMAHTVAGRRSMGMMAVPLDNAGDFTQPEPGAPASQENDGAEVSP